MKVVETLRRVVRNSDEAVQAVRELTMTVANGTDSLGGKFEQLLATLANQSEISAQKLDQLAQKLGQQSVSGTPVSGAHHLPGSVFWQAAVQPPEIDFETASLAEIIDAYLNNGAVLLRKFVSTDALTALAQSVDALYKKLDQTHIYPQDMHDSGLPQFHEYLFTRKHCDLLSQILTSEYEVDPNTATRRIDPNVDQNDPNKGWQRPLGAHLDAFFHSFAFTVNFWVPFQDCGLDTPRLGVILAPFGETAHYVGYDGGSECDSIPFVWNLPRFSPAIHTLVNAGGVSPAELLGPTFGSHVWTPTYALGDAMMLSNWTLHFTHAAPGMNRRRRNVELRFRSNVTLAEIMSVARGASLR